MKKYWQHYILLLPFMLAFTVFFLYPIASGLIQSFYEWKGPQVQLFAGLSNYGDILTSRNFDRSMSNLIQYVAITVPLGISAALGLALLVDHFTGRAAHIFRAAYFLPVMLPLFLAATIWRWMYTPNFGMFNIIIEWFGGKTVNFLNDPDTMLYSAIAVDIWVSAGFNMVIILAGLKNVPQHYYEAARLDGASKFQQIIWVTIPSIWPVLLFVITYGLISAMQVFDIPWLLTGSSFADYGGRKNQLLFPVMDMMGRAFGSIKFGEAAAYGFMLTLAIVLVTTISLSLGRERK